MLYPGVAFYINTGTHIIFQTCIYMYLILFCFVFVCALLLNALIWYCIVYRRTYCILYRYVCIHMYVSMELCMF